MKKHKASDAGTAITLQNARAKLTLDLFGGAITDFHLLENKINPLSFKFTQAQMPENNRAGAPYQGHFICLGRWGEPSVGEKMAGMPNHGQFANILWQLQESGQNVLRMTATAPLEGLQLNRSLLLDTEVAAFAVEEQVTNINPLGRVYNLVQHPTISAPFLDGTTRVDCNAVTGFNQHFSITPKKYSMKWPTGYTDRATAIDLSIPEDPYDSVFSFVVDKASRFGWLTAFSPTHKMLIGYVWKRGDYPWIHLWQSWSGNTITYRGIEFGTAGIHQPFKQILATAPRVFGESTYAYIDAGETVSRRYLCFLMQANEEYAGVDSIDLEDGQLHIRGKQQDQHASISTTFKGFL